MNAQILVLEALAKHALSCGNNTAIAADERSISFRELFSLVENLSIELGRLCPLGGHLFGLCFSDPIKHLVVSLALLKNGAGQISIPVWESVLAKKNTLATVDVLAVISDTSGWTDFDALVFRISDEWGLSCVNAIHVPAPGIPSESNKSNAALVFFGSGTTGIPKIMSVDFDLLGSLIERDLEVREFLEGERHYCPSSLDYFTAKRRALGCLVSAVCIMLPNIKSSRLIGYCLDHKIQHLSMTTNQAVGLLRQVESISSEDSACLPAVRSLFVGSSPVSETVRNQIRQRISSQLFVVYGSNEFGEATVATPNDLNMHPGTVGRACPGVALDIVDASGVVCPAGVNGYIRLKSRPMMSGYFGDSGDTNTNFRGEYYFPGDMGTKTSDGNLIFLGRLDDMMIFRGVNIFPRDIEKVLESHPNVTDAAAFPLHTEEQEQIPFAVVCAQGVSEADLLNYCQDRLGWRKPHRIFFTSELPRNQAGKVLKRTLANIVANKLSRK